MKKYEDKIEKLEKTEKELKKNLEEKLKGCLKFFDSNRVLIIFEGLIEVEKLKHHVEGLELEEYKEKLTRLKRGAL